MHQVPTLSDKCRAFSLHIGVLTFIKTLVSGEYDLHFLHEESKV